MEIKKTRSRNTLILKPLSHRLGFSPQIKETLFTCSEEHICNIIINCSEVEFFDTGFLGIVVGARKKGCTIGFCRVNKALLSIFTLTGTDKIFHFFETQKEAIDFFSREGL